MKYADYIVIPRSTFETAMRATENALLRSKAVGVSDSFVSGIEIGFGSLKSIEATIKPLEPLIEDAFEAGGKRFLDVEKFNGSEYPSKEQYLNKEL